MSLTNWCVCPAVAGSFFTSGPNQFRLPLQPFAHYDFTIDWGDGTTEVVRNDAPADLLIRSCQDRALEDAGQTHQLVSDTLGGVIEPDIAFIWVIIGVSPHAFYADFLFV